jgi:asparagine synthase (glutamine-hydrolysing)
LPKALFQRPKQGFDVPIGAWLKGPLRDWARDLLDESRIRREGLLDARQVESCWQEHLSGRRDRARELWAVLMVQAWLDAMREPIAPAPSSSVMPEAAAVAGGALAQRTLDFARPVVEAPGSS